MSPGPHPLRGPRARALRARRAPRGRRLAAALVAAAALLAAPAQAGAIPAGFDLFETDPEVTVFAFRDEFAIPAGFFAPDSQPFSALVRFGGVPIERIGRRDVGDTDTVVQRREPADLGGPGTSDTVPIEIVQLSLVSATPIQVRTGRGTELWQVNAFISPSRPSIGQLRVDAGGGGGGTFGSELNVFPRFRFTRLSDGVTRVIDVGAMSLPPQSLEKLRLSADQVPWEDGCRPPALSVRGLNDAFCPSFTTDGEKQLTAEQAAMARHGIRPAQPRVEHFKCYSLARQDFLRRTVALTDQIASMRARVLRPRELCNPVKKSDEPLENRTAHLECYAIRRLRGTRPTRVDFWTYNQFGYLRLRLRRPRTLCVPSTKRLRGRPPAPRPEELTDHFTCYAVRARTAFRRRQVRLEDQFHVERPRVLRPVSLCAPTQKNRERVQHPVTHLVCYGIRDRRPFRPRLARTRNQFGVDVVAAVRPRTLCVPSLKVSTGEPPPPKPPTPQPLPTIACSGQLRPLAGSALQYGFSCDQATTGFMIDFIDGRQISNPQAPSGYTCVVEDSQGHALNRLRCTGDAAAGAQVQGSFETNPPPAPGMTAELRALRGSQTDGPFSLTTP